MDTNKTTPNIDFDLYAILEDWYIETGVLVRHTIDIN